MKKLRKIISWTLMVLLVAAGFTGWLQTRLDLHRFILHQWLAYAVLALTAAHVAPLIVRRIKRFKRGEINQNDKGNI